LCLDGAHQAQQALAAEVAPTAVFTIGAQSNNLRPVTMVLYELVAYSNRLTDAQTNTLAGYFAARYPI
jgi:hypothetical protein